MYNFTHDIGTIVHFGKGQIEKLPGAVKQYANKVLLTYGGGSIKKNGIYDAVIKGFKENGIEWVELSGIDPNPRVTSVREGQKICKEQGIEAIVAVGGGSTLDCSKAIACAAFYDGDPWDLWTGKAPIQKALPLLTVLTLSATGSEMDTGGVITNLETNDKLGAGAPILRPKVSILDPTYTYSVSKYQTAAGTADIISHVLEVYFSRVTDAYLQDRFCEALLKTAIHYGRIAMDEPENYEARANLMWTSSLAINDMIANGKACAWSVHPMEHELSAFFDITHGVGLAILTPAWMEHILSDATVDKFVEYAKNVFDIPVEGRDKFEVAKEAIAATKKVFTDMDIPTRLSEVGIKEDTLETMANKLNIPDAYVPLTSKDVLEIYKACF